MEKHRRQYSAEFREEGAAAVEVQWQKRSRSGTGFGDHRRLDVSAIIGGAIVFVRHFQHLNHLAHFQG